MNLNQQILIALPDMQDSRFKEAVILICEHNKNGAMGLVLNHQLNLNTQEVFDDLNLAQPNSIQPVFEGGPLNKNCGFVIHNNNDSFKSSMNIKDQLTLTTSKDLLEVISKQQFKSHWKFILGYAGWSENQLENEMAENAWLTCPADLDLIFNTQPDKQWKKALSLIGVHNTESISGIGHA